MDNVLPIVAHPTFTRAVLRLPLPRRKEVYIALRAIERGDEQLEHDEANLFHFDLDWAGDRTTGATGRTFRLLLVRGTKDDRDVALATDAFWVEGGRSKTSGGRVDGARRAWKSWTA